MKRCSIYHDLIGILNQIIPDKSSAAKYNFQCIQHKTDQNCVQNPFGNGFCRILQVSGHVHPGHDPSQCGKKQGKQPSVTDIFRAVQIRLKCTGGKMKHGSGIHGNDPLQQRQKNKKLKFHGKIRTAECNQKQQQTCPHGYPEIIGLQRGIIDTDGFHKPQDIKGNGNTLC